MKDKIIARFRAKFATVNLTKKRLEDIAAKLETKITDENEIDAKLDELNEVFPFAEIAKQDDRIVQLEAAKGKKSEEGKPAGEEPKPGDPIESPTDKMLKALMEKLDKQDAAIASLRTEKVVADRKTQLANALKDADEVYRNKALKDFSRMSFETEEAFGEYLTEAEEDLKAFNQKFSDAGLGSDKPKSAFGSAKLAETEVSPAVKQFLETQKAAQTKTA